MRRTIRESDGSYTTFEVDPVRYEQVRAAEARTRMGLAIGVLCALATLFKLMPLHRGDGWILLGALILGSLVGYWLARPIARVLGIVLMLALGAAALYALASLLLHLLG